MTGNKGAMAKLDLELYEADPEVEIDIKAAMEGLRNEAPIFAKLLDALVWPQYFLWKRSFYL